MSDVPIKADFSSEVSVNCSSRSNSASKRPQKQSQLTNYIKPKLKAVYEDPKYLKSKKRNRDEMEKGKGRTEEEAIDSDSDMDEEEEGPPKKIMKGN